MCLCVHLDTYTDTSGVCMYLCVCCVYLFVYAGTNVYMYVLFAPENKKETFNFDASFFSINCDFLSRPNQIANSSANGIMLSQYFEGEYLIHMHRRILSL